MMRKLFNGRQRKIRTLKIRIGVEHRRQLGGVRNGSEIRNHRRIIQREIGFQNGEDAIRPHRRVIARLAFRIHNRGRRNAGHHRHTARGLGDHNFNNAPPLRQIQISKLTRATQGRQPMHAGCDQMIHQAAQFGFQYRAIRRDGGDQVRENPMKFLHDLHIPVQLCANAPSRRIWLRMP